MGYSILTEASLNRGGQYPNPNARQLCASLNISAPRLIQRVPLPNWYPGATHIMTTALPRQIPGPRTTPVRGQTFDFGDALNP